MKRVFFGAVAVLLNTIVLNEDAIAQVVPDNTVGTTTNLNGMEVEINNGTRSGNNLFHSFSQFSVPTGSSAIFNNALDVQNIFSRVTGSQVSNIDGILKTQGSANLFLMNPNGIIFGPNARLELGGSFVGTTASAVKFGDGLEFNTVNATPALLSVNLPIGLQMGQAPGPIVVQGTGHRLAVNGIDNIIDRSQNPIGLNVNADKTLALIGRDVNFMSGVMTTNGGHLEVGSVQTGQVRLKTTESGWLGDYSAVQQFGEINLANRSLLDTNGSGGSIQLQGRNITLNQGSAILNQSLGPKPGSGITLNARESLTLAGNTPDGNLGSLILLENSGITQPGSIAIAASQLSLQDGAQIKTTTTTSAPGGQIMIQVGGLINVEGSTPVQQIDITASKIMTNTTGNGNAGNLTISAQNIKLLKGASIASTSFRDLGQTGAIDLNVTDTIEVIGSSPISLNPSSVSSTSLGSGNSNRLFINTARLIVREGGLIAAASLANGSAASLTIYASKSIEVTGKSVVDNLPSQITSAVESLNPFLRARLNLPDVPSGNAGVILINTPNLQVRNGAAITVKNDGTGSAGNLEINANSIVLDNQGSITALARSGEGGNLVITGSSLFLRRNSFVGAQAGGLGNGGNITIDVPVIVGLENSDIVANAVKGQGGNIKITTQGISGLNYRDRLTLDNDITASSEFGINGNVQVNTIGINPTNALNALPIDVVDSSTQITDRCGAAKTASFIATGRGGMPQNPMKKRSSDRPWHDLRPLTATALSAPIAIANPIQPLIEASALHVDESGAISLVVPNLMPEGVSKSIGLPSKATCGILP
jgi:filamentous hemagglutinin family protein